MTEDWMHSHPSTATSWIIKGDATLASAYRGDGVKLLYELNNSTTFNRLGMNKMTRLFSNGAVITAQSHFGMNILTIDVSRVLAVEAECTITLINLPDAIPPMDNAGTILDTEVEGIDFIKTYYFEDVGKCSDCQTVDFSVCTTDEISEDAALCKPFYYEDSAVAHTDADPKDHCTQTTSSCQAEIIDSGSDGGGSYIRWKAYTEWPPDDQSGLGYLLFKAFIKRVGTESDLCASTNTITVDCCEKNDDDYKEVHPSPEWGDLDIEYTSLIMGCDEEQELTAKWGCPPFTWTLTSGGGTLTPSEDGLTATYASPETNPNCEDNPTILLEDRCESSKELKLAVSCYDDPLWTSFAYVEATVCRPCGIIFAFCDMKLIIGSWSYSCNSVLTSAVYWGGQGPDDHIDTYSCSDPDVADYTNCGYPDCFDFSKKCGDCVEYYANWWTGLTTGYHDVRTQEMKDEGCCPINPSTGLPF